MMTQGDRRAPRGRRERRSSRRGRAVAVHSTVGAVLLSLLVGACDQADRSHRPEPPVAFDTAVVHVTTAADTFPLRVEVAETEEQRAYGLMERTILPEDHGMIFRYPEPQDSSAGFWMYRTRIPLDIAFLDGDGRIVAIRTMQPCESPYSESCPIYSPGVTYSRAVEVNRGYFERHGVEVGDRIVSPPTDG